MSVDEFLDQLLSEADTCACSHTEDRHGRNAAGPHRGACWVALCGCLWFRLAPIKSAATGGEAA